MRTAARVLDVRDERARLACDEQPACQACHGGRGCALRWLGSTDRASLEVPSVTRDGCALIAGQSVTIEVPDGELLRSAAKVYLLPLAGLLIGPALVRWSGAASESSALMAALTGVVLGWVLARGWVRRSPPSFIVRLERGASMGSERCADWVLYVRDGCHLCEQFLLELSLDLGPAVEVLQVVDVDRDADLAVRFGLRVPVLEAGGLLLCEGVYDAARVRQALQV